VTNSLNMPNVSAEDAPKLAPFLDLASKLGSFAGQLTDTDIKTVSIEYEGHVAALNVKPLDPGRADRPEATCPGTMKRAHNVIQLLSIRFNRLLKKDSRPCRRAISIQDRGRPRTIDSTSQVRGFDSCPTSRAS
jgi:hypothetical protein